MNGLEKIVSSSRKHWKEIVTAIALPFIFNSSVKAGYLSTRSWSSLGNPDYVGIWHKTGAKEPSEGYEGNGNDARFNGNTFPPKIDIYSKIDLDPYRLSRDSRPPESTSTFNLEISGRELTASEDAKLEFVVLYPGGEDNFSRENIIGELSQRVDDGEGGYQYALIGNYDVKNLVNSARTIPISINNGATIGSQFFPSHKLDHYCPVEVN